MVSALSCLLTLALGAPPLVEVSTSSAARHDDAALVRRPWSILLDGTLELTHLEVLPSARSLNQLLENAAQPVIFGIEESGGFSDIDREKVSIYGDSWLWTRWYLHGLDVSDPLFSGASAFRLPFGLLEGLSLNYGEAPGHRRAGGLELRPRHAADTPTRAGALVHAPNVGDIAGFARPLMDWISGKHSRDRVRAPPSVRRGLTEAVELYVTDTLEIAGRQLAFGLDVERGGRRYLDFHPLDGSLRGTVEEPYARASAAVLLEDHTFFAAELRQRGHAFAELGFAPAEALRERVTTLATGTRAGPLGLALTLTHVHTRPVEPGFARDLRDPSGEALAPFFPEGDLFGVNADLVYRRGPYYLNVNHRLGASAPSQPTVTHPLTYLGETYGFLERDQAPTFQLLGDHRLGVTERLHASPQLAFTWDLFLAATYALNASGENGIILADVGAKAHVDLLHFAPTRFFALFAKQPLALTPELARLLDPQWMNTKLYQTRERGSGALLDTTGGAYTSVAERLAPMNIYALALGLETPISRRFRVATQGVAKAYHNRYRLDFAGGPEAHGYTRDGVYFLREGEKAYTLVNERDGLPLYWGWHIQLVGEEKDRWLVSLAFSAYNAIGNTPFGNGALSNDVGVVSPSTANPNSRRFGLANTDGDRAFQVKAVFAARLLEGLWGSVVIRHRDGQPFAFLEEHQDAGQLAFTYRSFRGSPLVYQRPLAGPREDFHLGIDAQLRYTCEVDGLQLTTTLTGNNLLDLGNEIAEVNGPLGRDGRAALEAQIPRSILLGVELGY